MSSVLSNEKYRGEGSYRAQSTVRNESYANSPVLGTSGPFKTRSLTAASGKGGLPKPTGVETVTPVRTTPPSSIKTYAPGDYAAYRKTLSGYVQAIKNKKAAVAAKKPVIKPTAKKPATVVSNVTNEKLSPAKKAMARAKMPATRFGVVTGKTTGTRVSGGGGYGGGGTRGSGSLSGGGSGTRSAGTSRTGGTQRNDPVRG